MRVTLFGRELKRLRARQGFTVRDVADRLGKSIAYIGKIETKGEIPTPELIRKIADAFGENGERLLELAKQSLIADAEREINAEYSSQWAQNSREPSKAGFEKGEDRMATVVSMINMKGGVGKTTLAMQLAHAADSDKRKILAVDLDPQSNLSQALMGAKAYIEHLRKNRPTVVKIFDDYVPAGAGANAPRRLDVGKVVLKGVGRWKNTLDLIPSRLELSRTLKNPTSKERRLAKALAQVQDDYDLVIIDCAPTESILTTAAYFASRYLIVPIKPEFMATIGLPLLARSLSEFQIENEDHELDIAALVFNHSSSYTSGPEGLSSIGEVTDFAGKEGWHVCDNQMKYSASYAKAARESSPLNQTSYAHHDVISGFRQLKDELFNIIGI